jgi:ATP-dependent Clp protease protease subunit
MQQNRKANPFIYEKTREGEAIYDIYSRLAKDRIVFLSEDVDAETATTICATLLYLDSQSHTKPIKLYINSPGGEIHAGLFTIYDTMNYIAAPVHTVCIGEAYSAASMILSAGEKGERVAFPNAHIMIHEVQNFTGSWQSATDTVKKAKRVDDLNKKLIHLISEHSGQSLDKVTEVVKETTYFSPEEAVEFGLIDRITTKDTGKSSRSTTKRR